MGLLDYYESFTGVKRVSQQKVDRYKEYKKNKAQIFKREKMLRRLEYIAAIAVCVILVAWLGFSAVQSKKRADKEAAGAVAATEIDLNAYADYIEGLKSTFTA
ncbi:MAG: hypothetical protein IJJ52_04460 [Lachnospiraceae bacterium]|nr:hypothetical protein [Lachnospiraceae bacterium]